MDKQEMTRENIKNAGYTPGRSVKGKGTEVFSRSAYIYHGYMDSESTSLEDKSRKRLFHAIKRYGKDNLFIKEITINTGNGEKSFDFKGKYIKSLEMFPVKKLLDSNLEGVSFISVYTLPEFKTYVKMSKYDSSLESQQDMIKDLIWNAEGKEVIGEFLESSYDELDCTIEFSNTVNRSHPGWIYNGDYTLFHGPVVCLDSNEVEQIDGRMDAYNDRVLDDFWNFTMDGDPFDYIDPEEKVSVYARKCKNWYVTSGMEQQEVSISFKQDDGEIVESKFWYFTETATKELVEKVEKYAREMKDSLEIESFIANEIDYIMSEGDGDEWFTPTFNKDILVEDGGIDDIQSVGDEIMAYVDWKNKKPYNVMVAQAYEKYLLDNMDEKGILFERFKHLQKLREIVEGGGDALIYSNVTPFSSELQYAIKHKKEEYHFMLGELFNTTPKKLYKKALKSLAKRKTEKMEHNLLLKESKKVFIGVTDSTESGNCESGTEFFCSEHNIDTKKIGGIRGDKLLELACDQFTRRAVIYKIKSQ